MAPVKELTLTIDAVNEEGTFTEADTITGRLTFNLEKEIKVKNIFIKFKGDANVHWTEGSGDDERTYSAHKRYFKLKQCLIPQNSTDTQTLISKGIHLYNFSFTIPHGNMPSSFQGSHGNISYILEAKLSRGWLKDSKVQTEINFLTKSVMNVNHLMSSHVGAVEKKIGFFSKGRVLMDASINKMAYAPGETVAITANINNTSSKKMNPKFKLMQKVVYRAGSSTNTSEKEACKIVGNVIIPNTQKTVTCSVKIPNNQAPSIHNCDIISLEYYIKVYLDISFARDPEVIFPVVIIPPLAVGPYPPFGGPSNSDFLPPTAPTGPYPVLPGPGLCGYPAVPNLSSSYNLTSSEPTMDLKQVYLNEEPPPYMTLYPPK